MKKGKKQTRVPNYIRRVQYLQRIGVLPRVGAVHVEVHHDDGCEHWTQPPGCNCAPEIRLKASVDDARRN